MMNISFRKKLFISYSAIMIAILLAFAMLVIQATTEVIVEKAVKSTNSELVLIENSFDTLVSSLEDYCRLIASDEQLQEEIRYYFQNQESANFGSLYSLTSYRRFSKIISNVIYPNTMAKAICIYSADTFIYSGYSLNQEVVSSIYDDEFLRKAKELQSPVWQGPDRVEFSDGTQMNMFSAAKLIMDKDTGEKLGVVILLFDEESFSNVYSNIKNGNDNSIFITDAEGVVESASDAVIIGNSIMEATGITTNTWTSVKLGDSVIVNENGQQYLYTKRSFDKLEWSIVSKTALKEITTETNRIIRLIVLIGIFSIVLFITISYIIASSVSRPISHLTLLMKNIMKGDMKLRANNEYNAEIGVLASGFNQLMDRIQQLIKEVYAEQELKRKMELSLNQELIKPHFLYNAIGIIESLINLDKKREAKELTRHLSDFYKLSLSKGEDVIPVEDEIMLTKKYLEIQGYRYIEFITFDIKVHKGLEGYMIPKLTLQPIVENAIYHGLKEKGGLGKITLSTMIKDENLMIMLHDNGIGMNQTTIDVTMRNDVTDTDEGFGISSVDKRLKLYFGPEYGLTIKSKKGYYTLVTIKIPKENFYVDSTDRR